MEPFDVLRREATKLERSLEDKIARYHQLAHKITTGTDTDHHNQHHHHRPTSPSLHHRTSTNLLESAENGTLSSVTTSQDENLEMEEQNLAKDINRTLTLLSDLINTKMSPNASKSNNSHHSLLVKRYREIVYDCTNDFKKTNRAIMKKREQNDLFRGANRDGNNGSQEEDPAMEALLRERNAIGNSLASATSVLGQASETLSELRSQGASMKNVKSKVLVLASRVPGLNGLIENIKKKRGKDDMIVSCVIAACILFTLWYVLG
mmetsp:Transcript_21766/g.32601  ORF Transcript_21766/g.32601 Transcript_21766/m.32601 type:complete len:264 (+) Transcript_21766:297-1088(+)|eukprot:CAMPEP_0203649736 /NCGR_PEP_ID=MMETSP0088-20131115/22642_1 /ASSEMBLY_ACC=CAM_ASM_001087 /TAXON_ID=426623 /ORGANISM="Chaetoceros affinis, Strain CCMP159" /LENGTH=263 /DNA_ID=CAMNT_0050508243 /DNA_START=175 /DNA_END=966 /DNA_ORIENTATION=-